MNEIRYFSISRSEKDQFCNRAGYYAREFGESGIVPINAGWPLLFGNMMHKYLDQLAKTQGVKYADAREEVTEAAKEVNETTSANWGTMAEGMLRGFVKNVWPHWMAEYDVYDSEGTVEYTVEDGYVFRCRKDLILKSKRDGHLSYREYKTTSSNSPEWIASWAKHPQIHTSLYATSKTQGIEIRDCVVQGLYKGWKDKKIGMNRNIFTHGWVNREYAMTPQYSYEYDRRKGWELFATATEFDDLSGWTANMPNHVLSEIFPATAPIFPRSDIAERYFKQQMYRQREIAEGVWKIRSAQTVAEINDLLDEYFPQNFSKCQPQYGYGCEYLNICWTPWIEADPLGSGQFKRHEYDEIGGEVE